MAACEGRPPAPELPPQPFGQLIKPSTTAASNVPKKPARPGPAMAKRQDIADTLHGEVVADPYRWLEDVKADDTKRWMGAHQKYARQQLDALPGRDALRKRLDALSYVDSVSPPMRRGKRFFVRQRHADKEKSIWYWRQGATGKLKVLLDPNKMSDDGSVSLKGVYPSHDGKLVAYKLSENNADEATLYVMDVASGKVSDVDTIEGAKYSGPSWDPKGTSFYYTRLPVDADIATADRPGYAEIYLHKLGKNPMNDKLVFERTNDPRTFIDADLSRDGRFLFVNKYHGWRKNDVFYKDLTKHKEFQPFAVGIDAKFYATAWKGNIYVHSNHNAPRWQVYKVDPRKPLMKDWKLLVPQDKAAVIRGMSIIGNHVALRYLDKASSRMSLHKLDGKLLRSIALPGIGTLSGPSGNPEDDIFYYGFSSYTTPTSIYPSSVVNSATKKFKKYFEVKVPIDPKPYEVKQVWYKSKDGTPISMFLVHKKGMALNGQTPFILKGYGGFNLLEVPSFSARRFTWLEAGGAFAFPNLRGGGEYGEDWHRAGMLLKKQNVFDDFIGAAEYLIAKGYTKPERLAIRGGSNGGLLVGAAMVQRPELFGAVLCGVPLLDMLRYHLHGSGKTWIGEYGSADDAAQFKALRAYSPYHNVKPNVAYPALLMLSADSDDRVDPLHARKFVAAIRHATTSTNPVLLRIDTKAGHGGGDMVKKTVAREVDVYAFLMSRFGMQQPN